MSESQNFAKRYRSLSDYQSRGVYDMEQIGLKVIIKRLGAITVAPSIHIERDIDDHAKICAHVHVRKDGGKDIPRVPIFGKDIKVNQDFPENQQASSNENRRTLVERDRSKSKHRDSRYRSRSKDRSPRSRGRSRSREKTRRKNRSRSGSRHRSRERRSRSRSFSPRNRPLQDNLRRSRSYSSSRRRSNERRKRAVTPLRPGEYRPGHPDLRKRSSTRDSRSRSPKVPSRKYSRSRSPSYSSSHVKSSTRRSSRGRSKSRSPHPPISRPLRSSAETPSMHMPGMEYGFYAGYPQFHPMHPYRGRVPMVPMVPMYPPHMMMPRIPMMRGMPFSLRRPLYNSERAANTASKPATITSEKQGPTETIELVSDQQNISSSRQDNAVGSSLTGG